MTLSRSFPRAPVRHALHGLLCLAALGAAHLAQAQWPGGGPDPAGQRGRIQRPQASATAATPLPASVEKIADLPYGSDPRQRMDVYLPRVRGPRPAPVIFMVHGGAWQFGDKAAAGVVANKVARWVPQGFVLISVDYPMLPGSPVSQQARDVALALAAAQQHAGEWGAAPEQFILMGHSAGAHLVALLNANPAFAQHLGARPWLGAVALDSAMLDVPAIMRHRHLPLYDRAFGSDPAYWQALSPSGQLVRGTPPWLLVCSSLRRASCPQAQAMAEQVRGLGGRAQTLPQPLEHSQINAELGLDGDYTRAVEAFMASLDPTVARVLRR